MSHKDFGGETIEGSCWFVTGAGDTLNFDFANFSLGDNDWRAYTNEGSRFTVSCAGNDNHDAQYSIRLEQWTMVEPGPK